MLKVLVEAILVSGSVRWGEEKGKQVWEHNPGGKCSVWEGGELAQQGVAVSDDDCKVRRAVGWPVYGQAAGWELGAAVCCQWGETVC